MESIEVNEAEVTRRYLYSKCRVGTSFPNNHIQQTVLRLKVRVTGKSKLISELIDRVKLTLVLVFYSIDLSH